jgi:hypothetical protein
LIGFVKEVHLGLVTTLATVRVPLGLVTALATVKVPLGLVSLSLVTFLLDQWRQCQLLVEGPKATSGFRGIQEGIAQNALVVAFVQLALALALGLGHWWVREIQFVGGGTGRRGGCLALALVLGRASQLWPGQVGVLDGNRWQGSGEVIWDWRRWRGGHCGGERVLRGARRLGCGGLRCGWDMASRRAIGDRVRLVLRIL